VTPASDRIRRNNQSESDVHSEKLTPVMTYRRAVSVPVLKIDEEENRDDVVLLTVIDRDIDDDIGGGGISLTAIGMTGFGDLSAVYIRCIQSNRAL